VTAGQVAPANGEGVRRKPIFKVAPTLAELVQGPPPHNLEAERSALAAALTSADAASLVAAVPEGAWYMTSHQVVAAAIAELDAEGHAVDAVTVHDKLVRSGTLDAAGGPNTLVGLAAEAITRDPTRHVEIIREAYKLREVGKAGALALQAVYGYDLRSAIGHLNRALDSTADEQVIGDLPALLETYLDMLVAREDGKTDAVPTGWPDVDELIGGLHPGNLVTIGARTSHGKTATACSLSLNLAGAGKRVLYVSLEMPWNELMDRWMGNWAQVNTRHLRKGQIAPAEWERISRALGRLSEARIKPADAKTVTVPEIRAEARAYKADVVIVDYLQLVRAVGGRKNTNRENEVGEVSRTLKGLGLTLGVPVVALAQLNRGLEARAEKKPELYDLRDSGQIEQDSDVVIGAYRPSLHDDQADPGDLDLHVLKNRHGELGVAHMTFQAAWQAVVSQYRPPNLRSTA
jgi:replicative DNA helicase